ncbi:MAG: rhodanese-like domain-containing protein [Anaerolineae bacterium]|nr:rhodanese-like domain-containing protein [Anaerolineae bacterium]
MLAPAEELAPNLEVEEVQALVAAGEVVILDVREVFEYKDGHIPDAQLIPLGELPNRLNEVPRDETVIIVCRSGNRSAQAHQFLLDQGFTNVHNMKGGMNDWIAAGYEIEK